MGFELRRKFILEFEAPELDGLEVTARSISIDELLALGEAAQAFDDAKTLAEQRAAFAGMVAALAPVLVAWNIEEGGEPVPADAAHLARADPQVLLSILHAYQDAASQVARPLAGPSTDGEQSAAVSIPMEPLSESLAS